MSDDPQRACLAIADVSGYTGYLAGVELDHAQDILADLISTVVEAMVPFQLSKLEGDASFCYLPGESVDGSVLQDTIEGTYIAFRTRLRDIQQASSCECNACVRIPSLDLKFVIHHGPIAVQRMLGREELVGSEVILVHRLLKNTIIGDTGIKAYAFFTQAALDAASIDPDGQALIEHHELTDVAGDVQGRVRDLEARWQASLDRPPIVIDPAALIREYTWIAATSPAVTFEYLTTPQLRVQWDTTITSFDEDASSGRRGIGTTNHCLHGDNAVTEHIIDWRPPHYWIVDGLATSPYGALRVRLSDELVALSDGRTQVINRAGWADGVDPIASRPSWEGADTGLQASYVMLQQRLAELAAEQADDVGRADPATSAGRHLSEPISASALQGGAS